MKLKINDPQRLVQPDDLMPITKRLERILGRTSAQEASLDIRCIVKSGKAGVSVGALKDNEAIPMSVQCGKGGKRFRGKLSSSGVHVAQLLQELKGVTDPCLKIISPSQSYKRKGVAKSKVAVGPKKDKPVAKSGKPPTVLPAQQSDLQKSIAQLESAEADTSILLEEIANLTEKIAEIKDEINEKEKTLKNLAPAVEKLAHLRKELGVKKA